MFYHVKPHLLQVNIVNIVNIVRTYNEIVHCGNVSGGGSTFVRVITFITLPDKTDS